MAKTQTNKTNQDIKPVTEDHSSSLSNLKSEVITIVIVIISAFIIFSLFFPDATGFVGNFIKNVSIGLFGFGSIVFPFLLIFFAIHTFRNNNKTSFYIDFALFGCMFISIITLVSLITSDYLNGSIVDSYNNATFFSGGAVGSIFASLLYSLFGNFSIIILVAVCLILVILIFKLSFKELILKSNDKIKSTYKNYSANSASTQQNEIDENDSESEYQETTFQEDVDFIRPPVDKFAYDINLKVDPNSAVAEQKTVLMFNEINDNTEKNVYANIADNTLESKPNESTSPTSSDIQENKQIDPHLEDIVVLQAKPTIPTTENTLNTKFDNYTFPSIELLKLNKKVQNVHTKSEVIKTSQKLEETLKSFGVQAKVTEVSIGPTVTRYELLPGQGVKVSKISNLSDDLALNLAAKGIRIEAPIPGKQAVGIEVPNAEMTPVLFRDVITDPKFVSHPSKIAIGLGKDIAGQVVVGDIAKMPHLLIAGATGAGKSVCINTLIMSMMYKATPEEVKLLMIDPKVVELSVYNGIPHLLIPVVTEAKKAAGALNWAVGEMTKRYNAFAENKVRDINSYNGDKKPSDEDFLPQIVIIIDELADLMMLVAKEVEDAICRLAQMGRACGIHLIIATQRPSVDVLTGLIKANVPSRISFYVTSGIDSRTILDSTGAEKLLGKGDMLYNPQGQNKPTRIQCAFISDKEVEKIVNHVKSQNQNSYDENMVEEITTSKKFSAMSNDEEIDEFFNASIEFIIDKQKASASSLQRQFRIGYNRASRIIEEIEKLGYISAEDGSKPRKVLLTKQQWSEMNNENN